MMPLLFDCLLTLAAGLAGSALVFLACQALTGAGVALLRRLWRANREEES